MDPDYARAHNNLGVLYERQGRREEARAEYEAAQRADPGLEDARRNLERLKAQE